MIRRFSSSSIGERTFLFGVPTKIRLPYSPSLACHARTTQLHRMELLHFSHSIAESKLLFTPHMSTTSHTVKSASNVDLSIHDNSFSDIIRQVRQSLLELGGYPQYSSAARYEAVLMPEGSALATESVIASAIPRSGGKLLVLRNGPMGAGISAIARNHNIRTTALTWPEDTPIPLELVKSKIASDRDITDVAMVHCESSNGAINPIEKIGQLVKHSCSDRRFIVDASSTLGAVPINLEECKIDFLISSPHRCIQGLPGFGIVLAERISLESSKGICPTRVLDICEHWQAQLNGSLRITPPVQAIVACLQALKELKQETVHGRAHRYQQNGKTLNSGMKEMGFHTLLSPQRLGHITTAFHCPENPKFEFHRFFSGLQDKGYLISPGTSKSANCFEIAHTGHIFPSDVQGLLCAIHGVKSDMGF